MPDVHRQQDLYWKQLVELKVAAVCIRLHRNGLARWDRGVDVVKAVASSAGIASWVIWRQFALVWAFIIATSQVVDALKDVFPFSRRLKAASDLTVALERMFIDAQFEWEDVYGGKLSDQEIAERCRKLRTLQLDAESKAFPSGFEPSKRLFGLGGVDKFEPITG